VLKPPLGCDLALAACPQSRRQVEAKHLITPLLYTAIVKGPIRQRHSLDAFRVVPELGINTTFLTVAMNSQFLHLLK
jgi:hypothetical protein